MPTFVTNHSTIYFGTAEQSIIQPGMRHIDMHSFERIKTNLKVDHLFFLKQNHGVDCCVIDHTVNASLLPAPQIEQGDILITNQKNVGIGVITADCLPVIMHDTRKDVIAAVHAGWRGSMNGVARIALEKMQTTFGCQISDIAVTFGPSARVCCYQVGHDFVHHLEKFDVDPGVIEQRDGLYFDLPRFNTELLMRGGISNDAVSLTYNICTICTPIFNSHRRQAAHSGRQATVTFLHS